MVWAGLSVGSIWISSPWEIEVSTVFAPVSGKPTKTPELSSPGIIHSSLSE